MDKYIRNGLPDYGLLAADNVPTVKFLQKQGNAPILAHLEAFAEEKVAQSLALLGCLPYDKESAQNLQRSFFRLFWSEILQLEWRMVEVVFFWREVCTGRYPQINAMGGFFRSTPFFEAMRTYTQKARIYYQHQQCRDHSPH